MLHNDFHMWADLFAFGTIHVHRYIRISNTEHNTTELNRPETQSKWTLKGDICVFKWRIEEGERKRERVSYRENKKESLWPIQTTATTAIAISNTWNSFAHPNNTIIINGDATSISL